MNWFERYGIVGAYFVCAVCGWYIFISGPLLSIQIIPQEFLILVDGISIKELGGIALFIFLPIGYVVMILSQLLYYHGANPVTRHHKRVFDSLSDTQKEIIRTELRRLNQEESEHSIESIFTYYNAAMPRDKLADVHSKFSEYSRKRFDVIAMNSGMIWSTAISLPAAVLLKLFAYQISFTDFMGFNTLLLIRNIAILILFLGVIFILGKNGHILADQLFIIGYLRFRNILSSYENRIRRLAYRMFEKRMRPRGSAEGDWLEAESVLHEIHE